MKRQLVSPSPLMGYIVVGGTGFVVDGGVMQLLFSLGSWDALYARAVSFPIAVTVTWLLNRNWTFNSGGEKTSHKRYWLYLITQLIGAGVNVLVFSLLIKTVPGVSDYPLIALAAGSITALVVTYTLSTYVIFTTPYNA